MRTANSQTSARRDAHAPLVSETKTAIIGAHFIAMHPLLFVQRSLQPSALLRRSTPPKEKGGTSWSRPFEEISPSSVSLELLGTDQLRCGAAIGEAVNINVVGVLSASRGEIELILIITFDRVIR